MFLDSDLTRSFIFDPLLVLLREIDIFHWGWNNGNFPLEINSRSINIFPYFWRIFLLVVFFIYNNCNFGISFCQMFFLFNNTIIISFSWTIFFYIIFTLNSISKKMIRIKIHWKRNKIVQNWKLIRLKYFDRLKKSIIDICKKIYIKTAFYQIL